MLLMYLEALEEEFSCFPGRVWEGVCRKLLFLVKLVKLFLVNIYQNLNMTFANRGFLHCAILKALHCFKEKRAHKSRDMQFFLQNVQNEIFKILKMF